MYKFKSKQISFSDFGQPVGMEMNPDNRWIKKADAIPWEQIELKYAKLFANSKGNVAKPLHLALGHWSSSWNTDSRMRKPPRWSRKTHISSISAALRSTNTSCPSTPPWWSTSERGWRLPSWGKSTRWLLKTQKKENSNEDDGNSGPGGSPETDGTLIVDATCAPPYIKYPQDIELLNEARENTEDMITELHDPKDGRKPRTYKMQAHKDYLNMVRKKRKTSKEIRKGIRKQLQYLERNLKSIDLLLSKGKTLSPKSEKRLGTVRSLFEQQKYMFDHHTHSVENRIISLSQPYLRPIVRGKIKAPVEFGAKLDISVCGGFTRLEKQSFEAYNESTTLKAIIERYRERTGTYPKRVLADKIYRNRDNLAFCKERGIRLSGPALGRPKKNEKPDRKQDYRDICERVEVERKFSLGKLKCGLGKIYTRLAETTESVIALSILVVNLKKICHDFFALFSQLFLDVSYRENLAFVQ